MKTNDEFRKWLRSHGACSEGMAEVGKQTPAEFYKTCTRGAWLLWWFRAALNDGLPGYPTIDQMRRCALEIARKTLQFNKDERLKQGLDQVEEYLNNKNQEVLREARALLQKVRSEYAAAAAAAAYAADAADAAAAYAAAYAARKKSAEEARVKMRKECADIVRQICPMNFD